MTGEINSYYATYYHHSRPQFATMKAKVKLKSGVRQFIDVRRLQVTSAVEIKADGFMIDHRNELYLSHYFSTGNVIIVVEIVVSLGRRVQLNSITSYISCRWDGRTRIVSHYTMFNKAWRRVLFAAELLNNRERRSRGGHQDLRNENFRAFLRAYDPDYDRADRASFRIADCRRRRLVKLLIIH